MQQLNLLPVPRTQEYSLYVLKLLINCAETARPSYRQNKTPKVICLTFGVRVTRVTASRIYYIIYFSLTSTKLSFACVNH